MSKRKKPVDRDMRPEYDFSKGVRGKYAGRIVKASGKKPSRPKS
ncbi:MAG: hypothetical protein ACKVXR_03035 [Planctomycetota bacterium]